MLLANQSVATKIYDTFPMFGVLRRRLRVLRPPPDPGHKHTDMGASTLFV